MTKEEAAALYEKGREIYYNSELTKEERDEGLKLIDRASVCDGNAQYLMGDLLLRGRVRSKTQNSEEKALSLLKKSAKGGNPAARRLMDTHCRKRYAAYLDAQKFPAVNGELVDFNGKRIKINRKGALVPIDAELTYENGVNVLKLSANVAFCNDCEGASDPEKYRSAVMEGFRAWAGNYKVFGSQKLHVELDLTTEKGNSLDSVYVVNMNEDIRDGFAKVGAMTGEKKRSQLESIIDNSRSLAGVGITGWSTTSRKLIIMQSESPRFDDYEEIKAVAKHEFGHALGLGDLYASTVDRLSGIAKGTYPELDAYHISGKDYNLVMCDHHGKICNNDIEMVVLAFRNNKMQLYQQGTQRGEISEALGRGN